MGVPTLRDIFDEKFTPTWKGASWSRSAGCSKTI